MYWKVFGLPWKCSPFENKLQWESWQWHRRLLCENWISLCGTVGMGHRESFEQLPEKAAGCTDLPVENPSAWSPEDFCHSVTWQNRDFGMDLFLVSVPWARRTCRRTAKPGLHSWIKNLGIILNLQMWSRISALILLSIQVYFFFNLNNYRTTVWV